MTGRRHIEALLFCGVAGCDTSPTAAPSPVQTAHIAPVYVPPPAEGCARVGTLDGVESDPACVAPRPDPRVMRDAMKVLTFELKPDSDEVIGGGQVVMRLTITNGGSSETSVVFDAVPPGAGPRPDWSRLAGVPEPKPASAAPPPDGHRLLIAVRTLDGQERSVDGLPITPSPSLNATRFLRVRLKPGGKLTHTFTWWALRIPAPAPITRDDAGHRFVPKTAPVPLPVGEFAVAVELPLHGIGVPESVVTTRVHVTLAER